MLKVDRVLLLEAHPDDVTISASGTISRLKRENPNIEFLLNYECPCLEDVNNTGNIMEHDKACRILGIKSSNIYSGYHPRDGYLEIHKQELRDAYYKFKQEFKPQLVLCPSVHEYHQDHRTVADCALTIFRDSALILGFEVLRSSTPDFKPNFLVSLDYKDYEIKLKVIDCYHSQLGYRFFFTPEKFIAHMRMRGVQANAEFAEAFEVLGGKI